MIKQEAKRKSISLRTLERAKEELGVESRRTGYGKDGTWFWELPKDRPGDGG